MDHDECLIIIITVTYISLLIHQSKQMTTKNPWKQNSNLLAFGSLEQFAEEIGLNVEEQPEVDCHYSFIDSMRAADKAAATHRKQVKDSAIGSLQSSPAVQFSASSKVTDLMSLIQSQHSHYHKYNNPTFLKHLGKEMRRKEANSFMYMDPSNRTYFFDMLTLAMNLSDEGFVHEVLEAQVNANTHVQRSIASAKSLLLDLLTLEDLVDNISTLQADFMGHISAQPVMKNII